MEASLGRYAQRIRAAASTGGHLRLSGGGTKDFYGGALEGEPLELRDYAGIVGYEPSELVVTARCGTPLAELEDTLARNNQMLPFEPPRFGPGGTLGGCIAAGLAGPRRAANGLYYGAVRDFVLGCVLIDGRADLLRFGGQVMKNVAGYDVSRLVVGSLGTLGILAEVSLKVLPVPAAHATLRFDMNAAEAVRRLNEWGGRPLPVTASAWCGGALSIRLEGASAAVDAACAMLGGTGIGESQARAFWSGLRDQTDPYFRGPGDLWRLSVPSTSGPIHLTDGAPAVELIEWGGALRWWKTDAGAPAVRMAAKSAGGYATLFRGGDKSKGVFDEPGPVVARLQKNVKAVFDPAGVFNRGRLYRDW